MGGHVQENKLEKFLHNSQGMCWVDTLDHFDKSAKLSLFEHIYKHPYIKKKKKTRSHNFISFKVSLIFRCSFFPPIVL